MRDPITPFTTLKLGPISVEAASLDDQLVFLTHPLLKRLKFGGMPLEGFCYEATATDMSGQRYQAITEEGLYILLLLSDAKVAKPFQNWVSQCVLPAVLLDRLYQVGEEKNGTPSDAVLDPNDAYGLVPAAFHEWLAETVLPAIRRDGKFFTDLQELRGDPSFTPQVSPITLKEFELLALREGANRKLSRFHQQPSKRRFARLAQQFRELNALTDLETYDDASGF